MGAATLALATVLSLAPAFLGWLPGRGWSPEGASFAALAALPWMALAGLPRRPRSAERAGAVAAMAAALAPLSAGAALDLRSGVPLATSAWTVGWALAGIGFLAAAAERGRSGRPRAFALFWFALVSLPAAWLAAGGGGPFAGLGPLTWCAARVADPAAPGFATVPWGAAACVVGLAAAAGRPARGSEEAT